jgi:hypothetical protein
MKKIISIIFLFNLTINNIIPVNVTPGNTIFQEEINYTKKRKSLNKAAIRQIIKIADECEELDKNLKYPKISLCFSGGGYRSMVSSLGFLNGAEKNNLLHATRYISTLSGSTWLLIPLLIRNLEPNFYKEILEKKINKNFFNPETLNLKTIYEYLKSKEKIELIDIWGALLSDRLFGDIGLDGQNITFKEIRKNLKKTNYYPFPIFTSVIANSKDPQTKLPYNWLEITPFQAYSNELECSIPSKLLGSSFKHGTLKNKNRELTTGFFMGMFGCPFCLTGGDIFNQLALIIGEHFHFKHYKYLEWFEKMFEVLNLYKGRFCPATIPNFSYGLKQSYLRKIKNLQIIDGAFSYNLPFPPLFRRKSNIIIICDASSDADIENYPELRLAAQYALDHKIYFPNIEKPYMQTDTCKIFFNPREDAYHVPMIIYFANPDQEPTLKLEYNSEEFEKLHNAMEQIVLNNTDFIAKAIKLKMNQLN